MRTTSALLGGDAVPTITHGRGVFLYDEDGREYLDGSSGAMTANIGHGVQVVADASRRQAGEIAFVYRTQFTNRPAKILAERLIALAPRGLANAFFVSSGSEATEYAIRLAVNHWKLQGTPTKQKVLGRDRSYHGMTMGALSVSGHAARRPDYGDLLHGFPVGPPAYPFRYAAPTETAEEYARRSVSEFENAVVAEGVDTVAAIVVEPIVAAAGGVLVPPMGYLRLLRDMCDRLDVLLIADEVVTGMGRTGDWFACDHEDVTPDLLLLGKGLSAGYSPVGGVLVHQHMAELITDGGAVPFGHTFSNNPLGTATCLAVLDYIIENETLTNVQRRGEQLEAGLRALATRHQNVADVRGRGLLWGFELVQDPRTAAAPDPSRNAAGVLVKDCLDQGLIVYPGGTVPFNNAVLISPPLTITEQEINLLLEKLEGALTVTGRRVQNWQSEEPQTNPQLVACGKQEPVDLSRA